MTRQIRLCRNSVPLVQVIGGGRRCQSGLTYFFCDVLEHQVLSGRAIRPASLFEAVDHLDLQLPAISDHYRPDQEHAAIAQR